MEKKSKGVPNNGYLSLFDIINSPKQVAYTLAVIMDCTGTYRTDDSYAYVTKLKVIDNSYHPLVDKTSKLSKFVYVFLYSKTLEEAPRHFQIGDVMLLRYFLFDTYETKEGLSVRGNYNQCSSEWQIIRLNDSRSRMVVECNREFPSRLLATERTVFDTLHEWSKTYFQNNSLKSLSWYSADFQSSPQKEGIVEYKDIDIVLRLTEVSVKEVNQSLYYEFWAIDVNKQLFFGTFLSHHLTLAADRVYKFRSVSLISLKTVQQVRFHMYSNILVLQDHFKDHREFGPVRGVEFPERESYKREIEQFFLFDHEKSRVGVTSVFVYRTKRKVSKQLQRLLSRYAFLESYDTDSLSDNGKSGSASERLLSTVIATRHGCLPLAPVSELDELLRSCCSRPALMDLNLNRLFRVKGFIGEFVEVGNRNPFLRLYSESANELSLVTDVGKGSSFRKRAKMAEDTKVVLYLTFTLQCSDQPDVKVPVSIFTYDDNPKYCFETLVDFYLDSGDSLEVGPAQVKSFMDVFDRIVKQRLKDFELVVQLTKNAANQAYFRLVDTCFIGSHL